MGWERRGKAGRLVYYRSRRSPDGKVVKQYVGTGPMAEQAAAQVELRRRQAEDGRRAVEREINRLAEADAVTAEIEAAAAALLNAALLCDGWHRPNYGPWRRKRDGHGRDPAAGAAGRDPAGDRPGPGR